jgi:hypothetical protein
VDRFSPVRLRAGRLLDRLLGDWWAPSRTVAAFVLLVIIGLVAVIGLTLGPLAAVIVVAAGAAMRLCCDPPHGDRPA